MDLNCITGYLLREEFGKPVLIGTMGMKIHQSHKNAVIQMAKHEQSPPLPDED